MNEIKAIVVDDEKNGRENLIGALNKYCPEVRIIGEASSALDAINEIENTLPQLVFLDIELAGESGFDVLNHFEKPSFKVIFVTAYDHYAIQAIRFSALDYILKPISGIELKSAIKRFHHFQNEYDARLEIFKNNNFVTPPEKKIAISLIDKIDFVSVKDIISCKGEGGYTRIYLKTSKEVFSSKPLIEYEELLSSSGFIRTHKAHIANLNEVQSFVKTDGGYLLMNDESIVPVSRRKKDEVLEHLS